MFISNETKASKDFQPHPKGPARGVCVEVVTTNKKTGEPFTKTGMDGSVKYQVIFVFQTDKKVETEEGVFEPCVHWEWVNIPQSIQNENSKLHKLFVNWEVPIKEYPTKEALEDEVIGRPAYLVFTHNKSEKDGRIYSNLTSCTAVDDPKDAYAAVDYKPYNQEAF